MPLLRLLLLLLRLLRLLLGPMCSLVRGVSTVRGMCGWSTRGPLLLAPTKRLQPCLETSPILATVVFLQLPDEGNLGFVAHGVPDQCTQCGTAKRQYRVADGSDQRLNFTVQPSSMGPEPIDNPLKRGICTVLRPFLTPRLRSAFIRSPPPKRHPAMSMVTWSPNVLRS